MILLEPIQKRFTLLSICPSNSNEPFIKFRNIALSVAFFIFNTLASPACISFIFRNLKSDLENTLLALIATSATTALCYMMIAAIILRYKITHIFSAFQDFYDMYKNIDSEQFMETANKRSVRISNFGDYFIVLFLGSSVLLTIMGIIYSYLEFGYANPDILFRAFRLVLPWNQNTLTGWFAQEVFSFLSLVSSLSIAMPFLTLFISFVFFHKAFYELYRLQFEKIDALIQSTPFQSYEIKKLLFETVSFHIAAKRIFQQTARVYGTFILVFVINTIVFIAASIFQLDLALHHLDIVTVVFFLYSLAYGLAHLYAYCYVGKYSTDYYLAFGDRLYESNWMDLPVELQKTIIVMIAHAQKELYYHGFHITILDLNLFTKLMKTILSYYLMFKTFTDV